MTDLTIAVKIDTSKLHAEVRARAADDCEWQGFPVDEENIAWMVAVALCEEMLTDGVKAEVVP